MESNSSPEQVRHDHASIISICGRPCLKKFDNNNNKITTRKGRLLSETGVVKQKRDDWVTEAQREDQWTLAVAATTTMADKVFFIFQTAVQRVTR